ncbi:hypothetical protein RRG08_038181 [Elysia crispata]|uniref:Uncharacterized protein n=1 Tax=Elysia crispata TaxID=231223 RepID=A0AAE1AMV5_9GAST|nr:hypothetical protein RRG08_038181 [Elysia crispata]
MISLKLFPNPSSIASYISLESTAVQIDGALLGSQKEAHPGNQLSTWLVMEQHLLTFLLQPLTGRSERCQPMVRCKNPKERNTPGPATGAETVTASDRDKLPLLCVCPPAPTTFIALLLLVALVTRDAERRQTRISGDGHVCPGEITTAVCGYTA